MQIYLPIADLPVNVFLVLGMGLAVGYISGMFGIGGGSLMTPLLIFIGISPAVAVATVSSHIAASSFTGALSYWRKRAVDIALALMLLSAGFSARPGVWLFTEMRALDQLDLMIGLSYVTLLTIVGAMMIYESVRAIFRDAPRHAGKLRGRAATRGCTDYRSNCNSSAPKYICRRFRSGQSNSSSALSGRSWASAAASCWCRC